MSAPVNILSAYGLTAVFANILKTLEGNVDKGIKAISLIKVRLANVAAVLSRWTEHQGVDVKGADIKIFADLIEDRLGISCSALSGANIASEVAKDRFSETTIGYRKEEEGEMWMKLFRA